MLLRRTDEGWSFEYGGEVGVDAEGFITAGKWYSGEASTPAYSIVVGIDGRRYRVSVEDITGEGVEGG